MEAMKGLFFPRVISPLFYGLRLLPAVSHPRPCGDGALREIWDAGASHAGGSSSPGHSTAAVPVELSVNSASTRDNVGTVSVTILTRLPSRSTSTSSGPSRRAPESSRAIAEHLKIVPDLPLALLGAPVDIGALVKLGSLVSCEARPRLVKPPPGTRLHVPFRHNRGSAVIHPSRSRG